MANAVRRLSWGWALALCVAQPVQAETLVVRVRVRNPADVPRLTLQAAQEVATQIYRAIDVQLVWLNDNAAPPPSSAMTIEVGLLSVLAEPDTQSEVLAVALTAGRIYVFCGRVKVFAREARRPFEAILGRVLAHEVGHQVLPDQGHVEQGIMQATLDYKSPSPPGFTTGQGDSIRTLLITTTSRTQ